jgi:methyl-accepting chemotaxis protein
MKKPYRRRNYFTKKNFQSRFILRFLVISLIGSIVAVILFNIFSLNRIDSFLFSMRLPAASTGPLFFREAFWANSIALVFIFLVLVFAVEGLRNRITGALFRIRVDLSRLIKGDLGSRVVLREGEEFKDFADELNLMAIELSHRFADIKTNARQISRTVGDLRDAQEEAERRELKRRLTEQVGSLESLIEGFKRRA